MAEDMRWRKARVPSGQLCACGCGTQTYLAVRSDSRWGQRRGEPLRYLPRHYQFPEKDAAEPHVVNRVLAALGHRGRGAVPGA